MKRLVAGAMAAGLMLGAATSALAQDMVVTNARILDGKGGAIARGTIVVRGGKIVSVAAGAPAAAAIPAGARRVDAAGLTVMPGFIDAHRHIMSGAKPDEYLAKEAPAKMREFLEAGFTTVYSMLDDPKAILELRRRLQTGQVLGPRLFAVAIAPLNRPPPRPAGAPPPPQGDPARFDNSRDGERPTAQAIPDEALRGIVHKAKADGFDGIKTFMIKTKDGPETHALAVVADEARKQGLRTFTHAVTVDDTLAAVEAKTDTLAHSPHIGQLDGHPELVARIRAANIPMVSTLGIFIPHFDEHDEPQFRDRLPYPWETLASGGQGPVNARLLWNAGETYGYGTDSSWAPADSLATELRPLSLMFSPKEIVRILTANAAVAIGKQKELGTLEAGKTADLVLLRGDPTADVTNLLKVAAVVKDGKLVIDKRTPAARR